MTTPDSLGDGGAAKLTPWFSPKVKPVRHGVYQVRNEREPEYPYYSMFDGVWRGAWRTHDRAVLNKRWEYDIGCEGKWRGLAADPKGQTS